MEAGSGKTHRLGFAFVLSVLTLCSAVLAERVSAQPVCVENADKALTRAVAYHRRIGLEGAASKLLTGPALARARWCDGGQDDGQCRALFERGVKDYVSRSDGAAALLYARDEDYVCVFLFRGDGAVRYARTAMKAGSFDTKAEAIRRRYALDLDTGAQSSQRALTRRKLSALRDGVCDPAAIERPEASRGLAVEAAVAASTPAAETELTDALFPAAIRDGVARAKHLSIGPFGPVSTLPLAAFKPWDGEALGERHSINFLLFAGEVLRPGEAWTGAPKAPLIFSNPIPADSLRAQCVSPLPFAEKEAANVKSIFGGVYLSGAQATRDAFRSQAKAADMIYFAAHGLAGLEQGIDDSFIALADANLTARDVQRVSEFGFDTRLVVMSACQTGLGRIDEFGVIGLARTFLDAGVQNTVMTLWNVDDASTAILMDAFNRNLSAHQPADALAMAQRALKSRPEYAAPFYWAGFAVYGNRLIDPR
jgi:hypothetical protein